MHTLYTDARSYCPGVHTTNLALGSISPRPLQPLSFVVCVVACSRLTSTFRHQENAEVPRHSCLQVQPQDRQVCCHDEQVEGRKWRQTFESCWHQCLTSTSASCSVIQTDRTYMYRLRKARFSFGEVGALWRSVRAEVSWWICRLRRLRFPLDEWDRTSHLSALQAPQDSLSSARSLGGRRVEVGANPTFDPGGGGLSRDLTSCWQHWTQTDCSLLQIKQTQCYYWKRIARSLAKLKS